MALSFGARAALGVGAIGAIGAGVFGKAAPAARDAMLNTAFGDPDADTAFLGDKLSPSTLTNNMKPAPVGGTAAAMMGVGAIVGGTLGHGAAKGVGKLYGGRKAAISATIAGTAIGAVAAPTMYTSNHVRANQNFYSNSPYNTSTARAEQLNASGDIVLGMHNSRG